MVGRIDSFGCATSNSRPEVRTAATTICEATPSCAQIVWPCNQRLFLLIALGLFSSLSNTTHKTFKWRSSPIVSLRYNPLFLSILTFASVEGSVCPRVCSLPFDNTFLSGLPDRFEMLDISSDLRHLPDNVLHRRSYRSHPINFRYSVSRRRW